MEHCELKHLSPELVEELDAAVGRAIATVALGKAAKAGVSLAFVVGLDEDAKPLVVFTRKDGTARKGSWQPTDDARLPGLLDLSGLPRLKSVTFTQGDGE